MKDTLILGTRKGLVVYKKNGNGQWRYDRTEFLAVPVSLAFVDERNDTWWACLDHGHWGCKLHSSSDAGHTWKEVDAPKFPEGEEIKEGVPAAVKYLWAFAHGGNDKPDKLLIGTEPGGLFESDNLGDSFQLNQGLWGHPTRKDQWFGGGRDYAGIHSIIVDPENSEHIFIGVSVAGVFETEDGGKSWVPRNKGLKADFLPDPNAEVGQDPHLLVACKSQPKIMWQQNHCGIFKSEDGAKTWTEVSQNGGPANFGFAIAVDDQDGNTAWVVPAVSDEKRVAIDGALCVCRTEDGGKTWNELRTGLPQQNAFDIVFRHALGLDRDTLAFGTTTGNLYCSPNRGDSWEAISHNLPMVYSLDFV